MVCNLFQSSDVSRLVSVVGLVVAASGVKAKARTLTVQCRSCQASINNIPVKPGLEGYMLPRKCNTYVVYNGPFVNVFRCWCSCDSPIFFFFFWGTLFLWKLYLKNFNIKNKSYHCLCDISESRRGVPNVLWTRFSLYRTSATVLTIKCWSCKKFPRICHKGKCHAIFSSIVTGLSVKGWCPVTESLSSGYIQSRKSLNPGQVH